MEGGRAYVLGVGQFAPAGEWQGLPFVPARVLEAGDAFAAYLGSGNVESRTDLDDDAMEAVLRAAVDAPAGDHGPLIVHLISHGFRGRDGGLYVVGRTSEGARPQGSFWIDPLISRVEDTAAGPRALILLDVCNAGAAVERQLAASLDGGPRRAWVIAACGSGERAYNGRMTAAVAQVVRALHEGRLGIDPSAQFVPVATLRTAIEQRLLRLAASENGMAQRVYATTPAPGFDDDGGVLVNPHYRLEAGARFDAKRQHDVREFLAGLDETLDAEHYLGRAAGSIDRLDHRIYFTGRRAELRKLSDWVAGGPPLAVVTGSPGAGKSALLGVVVAVLHPDLAPVADTVRERVGADLLPSGGVPIAALHARGRVPGQLIASIAAQLRLPAPNDGWTRAALLAALLSEYADGTPPLIICDALDESADPAEVTQLLISLTDLVRPDAGGPVVRVLVGTRPWEEFDPLLRPARAAGACVDLDEADPVQVGEDVAEYVTAVLTVTSYPADRIVSAARVIADALVAPAAGVGPFLVARLYAGYLKDRPDRPVAPPRNLGEVLELYLADFATDQWVRPVLTAIGLAKEDGIPQRPIAAIAARLRTARDGVSVPLPDDWRITDVLDKVLFFLRLTRGPDGIVHYRLFHQALSDHLYQHPLAAAGEEQAAMSTALLHREFLDGLIDSIRPGPAAPPQWAAAEPYLLRQVINHAVDADRSDLLLNDTAFLAHADPETLVPMLDTAGSYRARLMTAIYRTSAGVHRNARADERRELIDFDTVRFGLLSGQPSTTAAFRPVWSSTAQADPALMLTLKLGTWIRALAIIDLESRATGIVGGADGLVRLVDLRNGQETSTPLEGHTDEIRALAVGTPGGRPTAVTAGDDGTVRIWDLRARIQRHAPINAGGPLEIAVLVADEPPLVAAAVRGGPVQVWTLDGHPLRPFAGHEGIVTALRAGGFDGVAVLVSAGTDHTVRIWDPRTGEQVAALTTESEIRDVALLHDGHRHLIATAGDRVELWDPRTGEKVATLQSDNDSFSTLTVLPDDGEHPQVAAAGRDSVVYQWDVALGRKLPRTGHTQTVTTMAAGRMGEHIVILSGAGDETIRLWDAASDLTRPPAVGHRGDVNALAVHRGHAFSAADDGLVAVWEIAGGARPRVVDFADWPDLVSEDTPFAVAHLADGDLVVAGGSHGTIAAWSLADGSPAWSVTHHRDAVNALATVDVADGQLLISGGDDQTVRVWNPSNQREIHTLDGHTDWVTSLSTLVVDGRPIVASGGNDGAIRLWDAGTGDQLGPALLDDADCINAVVLAEVNGRLIVAGASDDHLVRIWDAEHGKVLHRLDRHTDQVHALALLPGPEPVLVSGGNDRTLRLWHPLSGRPLGTYHLPDSVRVLTPAGPGDLLVAFGWEVALLRAAPA